MYMRYIVRFYVDGELKRSEFNRWEDALNEGRYIYAAGIDTDVDIKDDYYDVIFNVREEAWY